MDVNFVDGAWWLASMEQDWKSVTTYLMLAAVVPSSHVRRRVSVCDRVAVARRAWVIRLSIIYVATCTSDARWAGQTGRAARANSLDRLPSLRL